MSLKRAFFMLLLLVLLFSCERGAKEGGQPSSAQPANMTVPVSIHKLEEKDYDFRVELPGKTRSRESIVVVARVTGILQRMLVNEGSFVKKGQPLFIIERDPYEAEYQAAKAAVENAKAELERASADWKRVSSSYKAKLVSEAERDQAYANYQKALANLSLAQARLRQAEINLNYTVVKAEISGYVGKRLVDPGNLVQPGKELISLYSVSPLEVEFSIPERDLERLGLLGDYGKLKGRTVEVKRDEMKHQEMGKVFFVEARLDETASLKAKALIPNSQRKFLPDQFVKVVISEKRRGLLLPQKAVLFTPKGPIVYVIENGTANPRGIAIEEVDKDYFLVKTGLKEGEVVALDNLMRLKPGTKVKVIQGELR